MYGLNEICCGRERKVGEIYLCKAFFIYMKWQWMFILMEKKDKDKWRDRSIKNIIFLYKYNFYKWTQLVEKSHYNKYLI